MGGNGKWEIKWEIENGEWGMGNGEWEMENGQWEIENKILNFLKLTFYNVKQLFSAAIINTRLLVFMKRSVQK